MKDFKVLQISDQMHTIEKKGVFLDRRSEGPYSVALFQIDGFYVELFFNAIKSIYKKIRIFENTALLDPYINQMDITDLADRNY
jgi:hypothetical protein